MNIFLGLVSGILIYYIMCFINRKRCKHDWKIKNVKNEHRKAYRYFDEEPPFYGEWLDYPDMVYTNILYVCSKCSEIKQDQIIGSFTKEELSK